MDKNNFSQYQSILDNLLDVKQGDATIFTKINDKYSFDFFSLFGENVFETVFRRKNFNIPLLEINLLKTVDEIENSNDPDEVLNILKINNIEISNYEANNLKKDFNNYKEIIIDDIKSIFQKQALK
ncbi:UNVERIFIED_CONTAM: hypothetical protein O8I53_11855 [Campylobacter lari]